MHTPRDAAGPGLHRVAAADPAARAVELVEEQGGRLCRTAADLDAVVAELEPLGGLDDQVLAELADLTRRWTKLSEVSDRTRQRVVAAAGRRAAPGGLAVHPDTVRERARRLEDARSALLEAERAVAAHQAATEEKPPPAAEATTDPDPVLVRAVGTSTGLRVRRNQAMGVVLAAFGLGLILLALAVLPLWAVLMVPLVASLWALRHLRPQEVDDSYEEEAASLLSEVGAFTDEHAGTRRETQEREAEAARLGAARSRAEEEVRLAERSWWDLAGPGVDPRDVDQVVRRFDPGLLGAEHLAGEAVGVRATDAALARLAERWSSRWEGLGLEVPPLDEGGAAVEAVAARRRQLVVLVGEVAVLAEDVAKQVPWATVVVVEADQPSAQPTI